MAPLTRISVGLAALASVVAACGSSPPPAVFVAKRAPSPIVAPPPVVADHELHVTDTPEAGGHHYKVIGHGVDLAVHPLGFINLPVSGRGDVELDLLLPGDGTTLFLAKTTGSVHVHCHACRLGDDHATLHSAAGELHVGHVDIDDLDATFAVGGGRVQLTSWHVASPDLRLELALSIELGITDTDSKVDACLRFAGTPSLAQRDPAAAAMIAGLGAPRGPDGLYHIKLAGPYGALQRLGVVCGPTT